MELLVTVYAYFLTILDNLELFYTNLQILRKNMRLVFVTRRCWHLICYACMVLLVSPCGFNWQYPKHQGCWEYFHMFILWICSFFFFKYLLQDFVTFRGDGGGSVFCYWFECFIGCIYCKYLFAPGTFSFQSLNSIFWWMDILNFDLVDFDVERNGNITLIKVYLLNI